jgi:uncharacterized protein (TIGR03546 family)
MLPYQFRKGTILFRKAYLRFVRMGGHPHEIALGFALGIFVAMTPTFGLQMLIAVFCASLFKWNLLSAAIGAWITNPLTAPIIYTFTYMVGSKLLDMLSVQPLSAEKLSFNVFQLLHQAPRLLGVLIFGGFVVGIPLAIVSYYLAYFGIVQYRRRRHHDE